MDKVRSSGLVQAVCGVVLEVRDGYKDCGMRGLLVDLKRWKEEFLTFGYVGCVGRYVAGYSTYRTLSLLSLSVVSFSVRVLLAPFFLLSGWLVGATGGFLLRVFVGISCFWVWWFGVLCKLDLFPFCFSLSAGSGARWHFFSQFFILSGEV